MPEKAIKPSLVWDGTELCTVGFLSRSIVSVDKDKVRYIGRIAQVIELYNHSTNKTMSLKKICIWELPPSGSLRTFQFKNC
jgi:hypothetical protein